MFIGLLALLTAQSAPSGTEVLANAPKGGGERICRAYPTPGSRVARDKVCKTAEQWQAYDEERMKLARMSPDGIVRDTLPAERQP